jgi:hypothetical protein
MPQIEFGESSAALLPQEFDEFGHLLLIRLAISGIQLLFDAVSLLKSLDQLLSTLLVRHADKI